MGDLIKLQRILNQVSRRLLGEARCHLPPADKFKAVIQAIYGADGSRGLSNLQYAMLHSMLRDWSPDTAGAESALELEVAAMCQAIPKPWMTAARATLPAVTQPQGHLDPAAEGSPEVEAAVRTLVARMGWPAVAHPMQQATAARNTGTPISVVGRNLTVKSATCLQLSAAFEEQRRRRHAYVTCAMGRSGEGAQGADLGITIALAGLEEAMQKLWSIKWENKHKEILWRLSVNGVRGAGGHDISLAHPCACGWSGPPTTPNANAQQSAHAWRAHYFWECPVAKAVVREMRAAVPATVEVTCANLWLLQPPNETVLAEVWAFVCMIALEAMDWGRRCMWAMLMKEREQNAATDPQQTLITDFFPVTEEDQHDEGATTTAPERASKKAAVWFWCLLQDFVALKRVPDSWGTVPPTHPFMGGQTGADQHQTLALNLPAGVNLPADIT